MLTGKPHEVGVICFWSVEKPRRDASFPLANEGQLEGIAHYDGVFQKKTKRMKPSHDKSGVIDFWNGV
jgi:hypothetical protein